MEPTPNVYRIQVIIAVIGFFDIFALGFMQSFIALFVSEAFGISLLEATFWTGIAALFKRLAYAGLSPIWGWLSDRVGCKKMLIRVMAGHAITHFLMFLSRNIYEFTAFLCLDGALGAMSVPVFTLLARITKPEKLPQVLSYQQSIQTVGTLLAPGIGAALAYTLGYRLTYLTAALIFAGLIPLILFFLYEPRQEPETSRVPRNGEQRSDFTTITEKMRRYSHLIGLDFIGLMVTSTSIAFINPIKPLCLQSLGIVEKGDLLFYMTMLSTLSSVVYLFANPVGTRYVKRHLLPFLSLGAMVMAVAQSPLNDLTLFIIFSISIRAIQAPIQSHIMGGSGKKQRTGTTIGILQAGRYVGSAIGPFVASTIATTISLPATFMVMASLQLLSSLFLFIRNRQLDAT